MSDYIKVIKVAEELYRIKHIRYWWQLWAKCKTRKILGNSGRPKTCAVTGNVISKGEFVYRPMTNGYNRMDRISEQGIQILEANR